jgi:hypothetical protein
VDHPPLRLAILVVVAAAATACTGGGGGSGGGATSPPTSAPPTVDTGPIQFQPGQYRYDFGGVTATLSLSGMTATLEVQNASGAELGPPGIYAIGGDDTRRDAEIADAAPIPDGDSGTFTVSFPKELDPKTLGLLILRFGDSNYGAFAPVPVSAG